MSSISLSYQGALADNNVLDMYDASRGLVGFQRSLALIARQHYADPPLQS